MDVAYALKATESDSDKPNCLGELSGENHD